MFSYHASDSEALEIVQKACIRSFSNIISPASKVFIYISPTDEMYDEICSNAKNRNKILIFGTLTLRIGSFLGLSVQDYSFEPEKASAEIDHAIAFNTTEYRLRYRPHSLNQKVPYEIRHFARFDFTDEWNNHGYGRITVDKSIWSVSSVIKNETAKSLVVIEDSHGFVSEFATLKDFETSSLLYINRPIGLVDGLDWGIVENFLCRYRIDELVAVPLILDLPKGVKGVVSSRLDCDQSIINAKPIVDLYKTYGINISLGISTGIPIDPNDIDFIQEFHNNSGSLVSHTVTHHYSWGRDYAHALEETIGSKQWLEEHISGLKVDYAVSPFHSNEPFAIQALADAGYKGFISGIIHNDPEYLIGVSGEVPFIDKKIISHSQQCMMHGDCFHRYGNTIQPYKESFEMHLKAEKMFGYLDHPFGGYDYGWSSEKERLDAHKLFIEYIQSHEGIYWMTLDELLDFVIRKSETQMEVNNDELKIVHQAPDVVIEYCGQLYEC